MELATITVIGLLASVATQWMKGLDRRIGGTMAQLVAFVSVLVIAFVWIFIKAYAPVEFAQLVVSAFALSVTWYELLIKRIAS